LTLTRSPARSDYDRLQFAPRETQLAHLARLLALSQRFALPLFLHSRHPDAHTDLVRTLRAVGYDRTWPRAVVHSFTGTTAEMQQLVEMGLYIGMNGCSLKTEPNLAVARAVPLHRLCVETDAPWCSITSTSAAAGHYAAVVDKVKPDKLVLGAGKGAKGRNEPAEVVAVAQVLANVRGEDGEVFARAVWGNTLDVFWPGEVER
jgi:TatD DNase family protein